MGVRGGAVVALAGMLVAAALAGCTDTTNGSGSPPSRGTAAPPATAATPGFPAASGHSASAASPTSSATAADGPNVTRCADGRCEVVVHAGVAVPVPRSMQVTGVKITGVRGGRVLLTGRDLGNSSGGGCTGQCDSAATNGTFKISLGRDSAVTENGFALTVVHIDAASAIVRIAPA